MRNAQVDFNKSRIIVPFVIIISAAVLLIIFTLTFCIPQVHNESKNAIPFLILVVLISLYLILDLFFYIKALILLIRKIPLLILTPEFCISDLENMQLPWKEIVSIGIMKTTIANGNFLAIKTINESVIYNPEKKYCLENLRLDKFNKKIRVCYISF